jgi:hypothetical protein
MNGKYFTTKKVEGFNLMMFQGKTFMLKRLVVVAWYDEYLAHPGKKHTEETMPVVSLIQFMLRRAYIL